MESIVAATAGVAKLFMQEDELGKILPGYYADCILVNGDPLKDISILQDHDKLDFIMINGRIHKSAPSDFVTQVTQIATISSVKDHYNFIAFEDQMGGCHIGHLDLRDSRIHSLTMASGSPLSNMYQVIELKNDVRRGEDSFSLDSVKLLPPLAGRDVLCIGNNYVDHVKECNPNGADKEPQKQGQSKIKPYEVSQANLSQPLYLMYLPNAIPALLPRIKTSIVTQDSPRLSIMREKSES